MFLTYLRFVERKLEIYNCKSNKPSCVTKQCYATQVG